MVKRIIGILVPVVLLGLMGILVASCSAEKAESKASTSPTSIVYTLPPSSTGSVLIPKEPDPVDPLISDGTWMVPSDIKPGTYRTAVKPGSKSSFWQLCSDLACKYPDGYIDNDVSEGPGVVVIPPNSVSIELDDIILTPMGG